MDLSEMCCEDMNWIELAHIVSTGWLLWCHNSRDFLE